MIPDLLAKPAERFATVINNVWLVTSVGKAVIKVDTAMCATKS